MILKAGLTRLIGWMTKKPTRKPQGKRKVDPEITIHAKRLMSLKAGSEKWLINTSKNGDIYKRSDDCS